MPSIGNVLYYGADLSGTNDSTSAIQSAATAIRVQGGGVLYFPAGTYMINRNIFLGTGTTVRGDGPKASIITANPTYVGVNGGGYSSLTSPFLMNYNYTASSLTDTDIAVEEIGFNWGSVTITNGGAFSISFRYVDRVRIYNVFSQNGENVTALLNCRDTKEYFCNGLNCSNCYYDHWDGVQGAEIIGCTGRTLSGYTNQGIQFTGQGSYGDAAASQNVLVMGCQLYGIHSSANQASAIIANANGASSSIARMLSIGNYCDTCDNGIVLQGAVGRCESDGDYFRNVSQAPIFFHTDASGSPSNCRVVSATLEDCNHVSGSALASVLGANNRVEDLFVFSPSGVAYALIGIFPAAGSTCYMHIASAPNGTGGYRWSNSGLGSNLIKDLQDYDAQPTTNLTSGFPTIASAATIAPFAPISYVSGLTTITNITPPSGIKYAGGQITLIPSGGASWVTSTSGNIALASTAISKKALVMTYDPDVALWYPSY